MIPALFLSPIFRKVALYGAIILAVAYGVRWYSNRQWSQGFDQGKQAGIAEIEKAKAAEWKAREAGFKQAYAVADQKLEAADSVLKQAKAAQSDARSTLNNILAQSQGRVQATNEQACIITADAIDDALRQLSASLAAPEPK